MPRPHADNDNLTLDTAQIQDLVLLIGARIAALPRERRPMTVSLTFKMLQGVCRSALETT